MGATREFDGLSDAAGRRAAHGAVARLSLTLRRFSQCETGATAIEYGLLAALLGLFVFGAAGAASNAMSTTFGAIVADLGAALN